MEEGMKIVKLTASNYKRLKAIEITPDGNTVKISGKNGAGKSSALDAIQAALAGGKQVKKPIRDGEERAEIILELDNIIVTRTWTANNTSTLTVESKDGAKFPSPQALLDALVGRLTFDPLAFAGLNKKEQVTALLESVELGIDLPAVIEERKQFFDDRTDTNRDVKRLEGVLKSLTKPEEGTPTEEVNSLALLEKLGQAQELQRQKHQAQNDISSTQADCAKLVAEIETIKQELIRRKELLENVEGIFKAITVPDIKALQEEVSNLEETNGKIRKAKEYFDALGAYEEELVISKVLTKYIDKLDTGKAEAIKKAKMPVEGLSFDEDGLTFNGIPFAQVSSAEQLRISTAMAMAANPKLRVIRITDGSLLDSESMKMMEQLAKDKDYQIWIEIVSDTGKVGVYIEDGEIK